MVNRYGYTWEYLTTSGGGEDADGNPIAAIEVWVPFECDVQAGLSGGSYAVGVNGDNITVTYSLFTKVNVLGAVRVRSDAGIEFNVLQIHDYKINREIWV
jgi:hypothetical protein